MRKRLTAGDKIPDPSAAAVRAELAKQRRTAVAATEPLGLSYAGVNRRLSGDVAFTVPELRRLAAWLGVPVEQLLGDDVAALPEAVPA